MRIATLGLILAAVVPVTGQDRIRDMPKPFRGVNIPAREHGYGNFKTQVLSSQEQFDAFLKESVGQLGWNNRAGFVDGLKQAKIDFTKESLVLLRNTEGSGSNKVTLQPPEVKDGTLICRLSRVVPPVGTDDIADYCFALAVDRSRIKEVRYEVPGSKPVTLAIKK